MKKIILFLLSFMFVLTIPSCAEIQTQPSKAPQALIKRAAAVLEFIRSKDFESLSSCIHPAKGLNFSPYTRDLSELFIINFSKEKVRYFFKDSNRYVWGKYDGIGTPIELTPKEYYEQFIYDIDYKTKAEAKYIPNNQLKTMNTFEALYKAYPDSSLIFYNYKGSEEIGYKDFKDLILVFTKIKNHWYLEGVAHSESTL